MENQNQMLLGHDSIGSQIWVKLDEHHNFVFTGLESTLLAKAFVGKLRTFFPDSRTVIVSKTSPMENFGEGLPGDYDTHVSDTLSEISDIAKLRLKMNVNRTYIRFEYVFVMLEIMPTSKLLDCNSDESRAFKDLLDKCEKSGIIFVVSIGLPNDSNRDFVRNFSTRLNFRDTKENGQWGEFRLFYSVSSSDGWIVHVSGPNTLIGMR